MIKEDSNVDLKKLSVVQKEPQKKLINVKKLEIMDSMRNAQVLKLMHAMMIKSQNKAHKLIIQKFNLYL
jgi:hypothetical protein